MFWIEGQGSCIQLGKGSVEGIGGEIHWGGDCRAWEGGRKGVPGVEAAVEVFAAPEGIFVFTPDHNDLGGYRQLVRHRNGGCGANVPAPSRACGPLL